MENIRDRNAGVKLARSGHVIRNVNKKSAEKLADLYVRQAARISTEPEKGVEIFDPIGHVERDFIREGIGKLRVTASDFGNACSNNFRIDCLHGEQSRPTCIHPQFEG